MSRITELLKEEVKKEKPTCATCKFRTGSKCRKIGEYTEDDDWCSAYKPVKK